MERVPYRWLREALAALGGVEAAEVMQALNAPRRLPVAALSGGISTQVIFARTDAGRALTVATRPDGGFDRLIIGAREMTPDELVRFEAWEAAR
jgi:hypothetical protein